MLSVNQVQKSHSTFGIMLYLHEAAQFHISLSQNDDVLLLIIIWNWNRFKWTRATSDRLNDDTIFPQFANWINVQLLLLFSNVMGMSCQHLVYLLSYDDTYISRLNFEVLVAGNVMKVHHNLC